MYSIVNILEKTHQSISEPNQLSFEVFGINFFYLTNRTLTPNSLANSVIQYSTYSDWHCRPFL